jgi:hypothetical protein
LTKSETFPKRVDHAKASEMPPARIIEISAESTECFEDSIWQGINAGAKILPNIKGAWVKEQRVLLEGPAHC